MSRTLTAHFEVIKAHAYTLMMMRKRELKHTDELKVLVANPASISLPDRVAPLYGCSVMHLRQTRVFRSDASFAD